VTVLPRLNQLQICRATEAPDTRRNIQRLAALELTDGECWALALILIVEASQRPAWIQLTERVLRRAGEALRIPTRLLPQTLGPFQMTEAPRDFDSAALEAKRRLEGHLGSFADIALVWYGTRSRVAGSAASYASVLEFASKVMLRARA
jgi:hypothetical protein